MKRVHIVLVPGFAGFDALGQLEYYTGITPLFRLWQNPDGAPAALHYFDNFPTASVEARAGRLRRFLAKRFARGEFRPGDALALVGHSTGGLDICRLLGRLSARGAAPVPCDGAAVEAERILEAVHRVVLLSVPLGGTNLADWVRSFVPSSLIIAELRAAVAVSQVPILDRIEGWLTGAAARLADLDLLRAVRDALSEADAKRGDPDETRVADAQEAAALLSLWLRHMATDFRAIDDLAVETARDQHNANWSKIETRSYATLGRAPFRFGHGPAPRLDLTKPWTYPEFSKDIALSAGTDLVYRAVYRACAGGPFRVPEESPHEPWENDGIVNTASMYWPDPRRTTLVNADHMDIVGHYKLVRADPSTGREFAAYDLLKSNSGFGDAEFAEVWNGIFDFCAAGL